MQIRDDALGANTPRSQMDAAAGVLPAATAAHRRLVFASRCEHQNIKKKRKHILLHTKPASPVAW